MSTNGLRFLDLNHRIFRDDAGDDTPRCSVDGLDRVVSWQPNAPTKDAKSCRPVSSRRLVGLGRTDSLAENKVRMDGRMGGWEDVRTKRVSRWPLPRSVPFSRLCV